MNVLDECAGRAHQNAVSSSAISSESCGEMVRGCNERWIETQLISDDTVVLLRHSRDKVPFLQLGTKLEAGSALQGATAYMKIR